MSESPSAPASTSESAAEPIGDDSQPSVNVSPPSPSPPSLPQPTSPAPSSASRPSEVESRPDDDIESLPASVSEETGSSEDDVVLSPQDQIGKSLGRISSLENEMLGRLRGVLERAQQEEYERRLNEDTLLEGLLKKITLEQKRANTKNAAIAMRWPLVLERVAGVGSKGIGSLSGRTSSDSDDGEEGPNHLSLEIDESGRRVFRNPRSRRPGTAGSSVSAESSGPSSRPSTASTALRDVGETLASQEEMCRAILEGKERLLGELTSFLRKEEETYVNTLCRHDTQLGEVLETMGSDLKAFMRNLEEELARIADSFRAAESELERKQERSFRQLQEERRNLEESYVEKRVQQVEENEQALQKLNVEESENFARTKKEKDERLHELEATIDGLRGIFELTAERLKYYHSVLTERVKENEAAIKDKGRNLNQLQEALTDIKSKYNADDLRFKQKNAELTQHYSRLAKQYKDLVRKFRYFEQQDAKKYQQIWRMNQMELDELSNQLLQADKLITERILHRAWEPPPSHQKRIQDEEQDQLMCASSIHPSTATPSQHEDEEVAGPKDDSGSLQRKRILLGQLVSQLMFLIPEKDRVGDDVELSHSERLFLHSHLILRALGVSDSSTSTAPSLDRLIVMLQKGLAQQREGAPTEGAPESTLPIVSQDAVINAVSGALIDHRATLLSPEGGARSRKHRKKKVQVVNVRKLREKKARYQELCFWNAFKRVISKSKIRLWNRIHDEQKRYYALLKRRRALHEKNDAIARQNEELKMLLNQYARQKINEQLYIPPQ